MLDRDAFLNATMPPPVKIRVPALSDYVFVKIMTAGDRDRFEVEHTAAGGTDFRARLVVHVALGEDGRPLFRASDLGSLSALPAAVLDPIVKAAVAANKFTPEDVEDCLKNSNGVPSGAYS